MRGAWAKPCVASTTKYSKVDVVRLFVVEELEGGGIIDGFRRHSIDEI